MIGDVHEIFVTVSLILASIRAQAFMPAALEPADAAARQALLHKAVDQLGLASRLNEVYYQHFESEAGKYGQDFVDLDVSFEIWDSNQVGYRCKIFTRANRENGTWGLRDLDHGLSCSRFFFRP